MVVVAVAVVVGRPSLESSYGNTSSTSTTQKIECNNGIQVGIYFGYSSKNTNDNLRGGVLVSVL
jgi:hypothetical protein